MDPGTAVHATTVGTMTVRTALLDLNRTLTVRLERYDDAQDGGEPPVVRLMADVPGELELSVQDAETLADLLRVARSIEGGARP